MVIVLRNIAFYGAFYLGSVVYVLAALVAAAVARGKLMGVVVAWSTYHRTCLRLFAGIDVVEDGHRPTGPYFYAIRRGDGEALHDLFTRTRAIRRSIVEQGQDDARPDFGRSDH